MSKFIISVGCKADEIALLREVATTDTETPLVHSITNLTQAHIRASLHRPDLIVIDVGRLNHEAIGFIRRFHRDPTCTDIPVLALIDEYRRDDRADAILAGATDIITSPLDPYECRARVLNLLALGAQRRLLRDYSRRGQSAAAASDQDRTWARDVLLRFARAGELRDHDMGGHLARIGRISRAIASRLELPESQRDIIEIAAPMHDVGKIGIPDTILQKPGPLTPEEHKQMESHTLIGYELLKDSASAYLQCGAEIALAHHEKYDGSGYPYGIGGEEIPLSARIVAVADVYDALSVGRTYMPPWPAGQVIEYLHDQKGRHFDPHCVGALLASLNQADAF